MEQNMFLMKYRRKYVSDSPKQKSYEGPITDDAV